jgi:penicillin-binding protein 2
MLNSGLDFRQRRTGRLIVFQIIIVVVFVLLAFRIYQIQFVQRDEFTAQADENRFDTVCVPPTRGIILDRNNQPLAVNVASANVVVIPALLPSDETASNAQLQHLAGQINVPLSGKLNTVDERGIPQKSLVDMIVEGEGIAPYRGVVVKRDVDYETARIIMAEQLPGVTVDWVSARDYPTGSLTAQVIGYMGPIPESLAEEYQDKCYILDRDRIGYDGVEFTLEEFLAGVPGQRQVVRDVAGQIVATLAEEPAQPGYSVQLTIDEELQASAQQHLLESLEDVQESHPDDTIGFERGVVIAMNPRTGEILAMVSWPTYDNQRFARGIDYPYYLQVSQDPKHPLFNQAISSLYPPGSIFKVLTATAVLEEGVVTPEYEIEDPGSILLQNRYYPNEPSQSQKFVCWIDKSGKNHGSVNLVNALAWSCDVYFYKVGGGYTNPENGFEEVADIGLGIERLGQWMSLFGLGSETDVELAGETTAPIPSPTWKRRTWGENWSTGDTYNSAFGQGYVLVTPLQMIKIISTIANNGIVARPTLVREIRDAEGNVVRGFQPDLTDMRDELRAFWPETHDGAAYPETLDDSLHWVNLGMREATTQNFDPVHQGTAIKHQEAMPSIPVAGKTGTAEFCDNIAAQLERCVPGAWPAHAWYMGYAPYGNPEIAVIAFVYNGIEGSVYALPIVSEVMNDYFDLKTRRAIEESQNLQATPQSAAPVPTPGSGPTPIATP